MVTNVFLNKYTQLGIRYIEISHIILNRQQSHLELAYEIKKKKKFLLRSYRKERMTNKIK